MRLGLRLLFAFFVVNGIAAFFVLRVFTAEIAPNVREAMEDLMVDTANLLAQLASDDLAAGRLADGRFAAQVRAYAERPVQARIFELNKQTLDIEVRVTDARGIVRFDSTGGELGQDHSRWRDVARTLRGEYGARTTRTDEADAASAVMHVSAPIWAQGGIAGVLTVSKPMRTVQPIIEHAERKLLLAGLWMLALSLAVGVAVTLWTVSRVRRLRDYAHSVQADDPRALPVPRVPGELGDLAQAMARMRERLQGHDVVESTVRALTHELKSPVAAIRGAGELLAEDLPGADRRLFAQQVVAQSERVQRLIERLLELSKLEHRSLEVPRAGTSLAACAAQAVEQAGARAAQRRVTLEPQEEGTALRGPWDAELLTLALSCLIDNAIDFSPDGAVVRVDVAGRRVTVRDHGPGVPDWALPRLGERFFSTPRPGGERSGSGLGLAIARRIAALHGGRLVIENQRPGLSATLELGPG